MSDPNSSSVTAAIADPKAVAQRAYELWEQEGRQPNRDLEYWLEAERQILAGTTGNGIVEVVRHEATVETSLNLDRVQETKSSNSRKRSRSR